VVEPKGICFGVVIEKGDELSAGGVDSLVIGGTETTVFGIADETKGEGEARGGEPFGRAVGGGVVDNDDFEGEALGAGEGGECGLKKSAAIPVDDDY